MVRLVRVRGSWRLVSVFVDDGSEVGVAVEGGAADAGSFGDGGERDRFVVCRRVRGRRFRRS